MAELWVREGYQKEFGRKIDAYTKELTDIKSQYTKAYSQVNSYSGDSNVSSCNIYLKKRQKDLQHSIDAANALKKNADAYANSIISSDKQIAESIHKESYSFYKSKGIGPQSDTVWARGWNAISTTASDFWHDACGTAQKVADRIYEFYEKNKYYVNIILDVIAVATSVALLAAVATVLGPIGVVCMIGAVWAVAKATTELVADSEALAAWKAGDEAKAEQLSNVTLGGLIIQGGENLDSWLSCTLNVNNIGLFKNIAKITTCGLEACQFVAELVLVYESFLKTFNFDNCRSLSLRYAPNQTWNQNLSYLRKIKPFGTAKLGRFGSLKNWLVFTGKITGLKVNVDAKNSKEFLESLVTNKNLNVLKNYQEKGIAALWDYSPIKKPAGVYQKNISAYILQ
jgi:hypothetical protein